jgi:replicative DNA helicase
MATTPDIAFERGLPASIDAERSILGAVLLENHCYNEAAERLRAEDFALDSHQRIFARMAELVDSGRAVDLVTLTEELARRKEVEAVGGVAYLASLTEGLPRRLSIEEYVRIVKDKSLLRQLIGICSSAIARAADQSEDALEVLNAAESSLLTVTESGITNGFAGIPEIVRDSFGTIDNLYKQGKEITGLATHFTEFDRMTSGLQHSELTIIAARPSMGKAQPLSAKILTPSGFIPMGEVVCGTKVVGSDGKACEVTGVYPQGTMPVYNVLFSDGTSTQCTRDHLWWTQTRNERRRGVAGSVKTLAEIEKTLLRADGGKQNHVIPVVRPVEYEGAAQLPVAPYVLGVLLGDGCLSQGHGNNAVFANPEEDILERVRRELDPLDEVVKQEDSLTCLIRRRQRSSEVSETAKRLAELGVMGAMSYEKAIPARYLRASVEDRRQLLAGLLDTDGHVNKTGRTMEYSTSSPVLAGQVAELARGLGLRVSLRDRIPAYTYRGERLQGRKSYRVRLYSGEHNPTRSAKHAAAWKKAPPRQTYRAITAVTPVPDAECQCIRVDAPDSLYVTDDFILTHNTAWAINIAQNAAVYGGKVVAVFSLEMSKESLLRRMLASQALVDSQKIQKGFLLREDQEKLTLALQDLTEAKIFIDDTPAISLTEMRAKARRLRQTQGALDLIVIDYLQLMAATPGGAAGKRYENRTQEVSAISRGLKALAKELKVPVVALSQLSRASEQRGGDKKPMLSDLRESGSIEQDADVVAFIHRESYYNRDENGQPDPETEGKAEIIIAKQRNGPTGSVHLAYMSKCTRFENLARGGEGEY